MRELHLSAANILQNQAFLAVEWRRTLVISTLLILILGVAAIPTLRSLTGVFFLRQDLAVGVAMVALFTFSELKHSKFAEKKLVLPDPKVILTSGTIILLIGGWVGHYAVMHGYNLSRDEQMAMHDAAIFAKGQFAAPVPKAWQEMAVALNREFISNSYGPEFAISVYRPINAFFHMLMLKVGLAPLTAPIMSAIGMIATWQVSRRIWPTDRQIQYLSILFYLCSAQIWAASMTTYAMSTLLALNMVWLALFLRHDATGYALALLVGFFATGSHQVPYHPLFAAPFIALLVIERRWFVSALFTVTYVAFLMFWLRYDYFVALIIGGTAPIADFNTISISLWNYITTDRAQSAFAFTAANLLRYFSWQHLLVLPLMIVAGRAAVRGRNWLLIAMIAACFLPPLMKSIMVPYQGHGWGYRYCHGVIGLTCILAAVGWRELREKSIGNARHFVFATLVTVCVVLPWHLWNASKLSDSYAQVDRQLKALDTDFVVVDAFAAPFAIDLVNNQADLSNRPLRLMAGRILPHFIPELCKRGSITLFPTKRLDPINKFWGIKTDTTTDYKSVVDGFRRQCPHKLR